ncbi:hypothetical protein EDD18DRAFT_1115870, partial [Armillaria luteobubalina]
MTIRYYHFRAGFPRRDRLFGDQTRKVRRSTALAGAFPGSVLREAQQRKEWNGYPFLPPSTTTPSAGTNHTGWLVITIEMQGGSDGVVHRYGPAEWQLWLSRVPGLQPSNLASKFFFRPADHVEYGGAVFSTTWSFSSCNCVVYTHMWGGIYVLGFYRSSADMASTMADRAVSLDVKRDDCAKQIQTSCQRNCLATASAPLYLAVATVCLPLGTAFAGSPNTVKSMPALSLTPSSRPRPYPNHRHSVKEPWLLEKNGTKKSNLSRQRPHRARIGVCHRYPDSPLRLRPKPTRPNSSSSNLFLLQAYRAGASTINATFSGQLGLSDTRLERPGISQPIVRGSPSLWDRGCSHRAHSEAAAYWNRLGPVLRPRLWALLAPVRRLPYDILLKILRTSAPLKASVPSVLRQPAYVLGWSAPDGVGSPSFRLVSGRSSVYRQHFDRALLQSGTVSPSYCTSTSQSSRMRSIECCVDSLQVLPRAIFAATESLVILSYEGGGLSPPTSDVSLLLHVPELRRLTIQDHVELK